MKKLIFIGFLILAVSLWTAPTASAFWNAPANGGQTPLPGSQIPMYIDPLPLLSVAPQSGTIQTLTSGTATVNMEEFLANILPTGFVPPGIPIGTPFNGTWVWGYRPSTAPAPTPPTAADTYIGPVFVVPRSTASNIKWVNNLKTDAWTTNVLAWKYSTDQTMHWADPLGPEVNLCAEEVAMGEFPPLVLGGLGSTYPPFGNICSKNYGEQDPGPIPAVVHLHGGEVPPELDGGPDAWFTKNGITGHGYYSAAGALANEAIYKYPNTQEAANIWFHDHVLGITRLNVYAGLAGAYIITDNTVNPPPIDLNNPTKIIPIVIQDRMFDINGQLFFPADSGGGLLWTTNPEHPYWVPEFIGDTIVVNGKTWPFLQVEPGRYRFLLLNGSNARTYELFMPTPVGILPFWVIGTDGGYLDKPALVNKLVIMPGERYDVIIDFTSVPLTPGTFTPLILKNTGRTPYPKGAPPNGATVGQIMQFRVVAPGATPDLKMVTFNPATVVGASPLRPTNPIVNLVANPVTGALNVALNLTRQLTLNEVMGLPRTVTDPVSGNPIAYPGGPLEVVLNNTKWSGMRLVAGVGSTIPGIPGTGYPPPMDVVLEPIPDSIPVGGVGPTGIIWYTELPKEGEMEVWEIINVTADAHPIHLHLVQFQIMNRQNFSMNNYMKAYAAAFGGVVAEAFGPPWNYSNSNNTDFCPGAKPNQPNTWCTGLTTVGGNPDINKLIKGKPAYLQGKPSPPLPQEAGWKDTVVSYPGQVLRLAVRWAPTDLAANTPATTAYFPFSPNGHGYVWHCHIIDHEDNEMMRPTQVQPRLVITPVAIVTGTTSPTILIDSAAAFTADLVGSTVKNLTTAQQAIITAVVSATELTTASIASNWSPGDQYQIVPTRTYVKGTDY